MAESLTNRSIAWPEWEQWKRVLLLQDYNTRVVMLGTGLLGMAAGLVGSFTLLRRRALMGDALSHATLPGVGLAFLLAPYLGLDGKSLPVLLTGAALSGILGVVAILYIRNLTRLKEDAALGIVLSVFFGAGIAILTIVQQVPSGHAAGLESFIYGKTASMIASDAQLIATAGLLSVIIIALLYKELTLLCFDEGFAGSRGYPVLCLDLLLMALVVIVTIIGLQAVGLVLMIALLVIPAAAARFWTHDLKRMTADFVRHWRRRRTGRIGDERRVSESAVRCHDRDRVQQLVFFQSALWTLTRRAGANRAALGTESIGRSAASAAGNVRTAGSTRSAAGPEGATERRESACRFLNCWRCEHGHRSDCCGRSNDVAATVCSCETDDGSLSLTDAGLAEASRLVHEHRLWELYLITHADVAPGRVDQAADAIEHVLEPELIAQLEQLLAQQRIPHGVVASPHPLESCAGLQAVSGDTSQPPVEKGRMP